MKKSIFIIIRGIVERVYNGLRSYTKIRPKEKIISNTKTLRGSTYDRNLAKLYAEKYAESPNTTEYPYYNHADCANFISQALRAGGLKEEGIRWDSGRAWFCHSSNPQDLTKVSLTWRSASYFRKYFGNENGIGRNRAASFRKVTVEQALKSFDDIYDTLDIGDVVQYGDPQKGDIPYHTQIAHSKGYNPSIFKGDLLMAQHSADRKNVSLYKYLNDFKDKEIRYIYIYKIGDN